MRNKSTEDLNKYIPYIQKTLKLAEEYNKKKKDMRETNEFGKGNTEITHLPLYNNTLTDYLESLDFETIKIMQILAYSGKVGDYTFDSTKKIISWSENDEKSIEIIAIAGNQLFTKFLIEGCRKAGLSI